MRINQQATRILRTARILFLLSPTRSAFSVSSFIFEYLRILFADLGSQIDGIRFKVADFYNNVDAIKENAAVFRVYVQVAIQARPQTRCTSKARRTCLHGAI